MASVIKEIARKLVDGSYENIAIGAKAENVITSHDITAEKILNTADVYNIEITVDKWSEGYNDFGTEIIIQDDEYTWEEILNKDIINLHFYAVDWGANATNYFRREEGYSNLSSVTFVHRTLNWSSNEVMTHYLYANLNEPYKFEFRIHRYEPATQLSKFENDTNFITNTVNNLTNYYKKTETYTQTEINNLLNAITTLDIQVITSKPESPNKTTIYLIGTGTDGNNDYEEWLYTDSGWELIGTTEVDLSNYATKDFMEETINNRFFIVETEKQGSNYILSNITFNELVEKFNNGGTMVCHVDDTDYIPLLSVTASKIMFSGIYQQTSVSLDFDTNGVGILTSTRLSESNSFSNYYTKTEVDNLIASAENDLNLTDPQPYEEVIN